MDEQEQQNVVNEEQNVQMEPTPVSPPPSHKKLIIGIVAVFVLVVAGVVGAYFVLHPKTQLEVDDMKPVISTDEVNLNTNDISFTVVNIDEAVREIYSIDGVLGYLINDILFFGPNSYTLASSSGTAGLYAYSGSLPTQKFLKDKNGIYQITHRGARIFKLGENRSPRIGRGFENNTPTVINNELVYIGLYNSQLYDEYLYQGQYHYIYRGGVRQIFDPSRLIYPEYVLNVGGKEVYITIELDLSTETANYYIYKDGVKTKSYDADKFEIIGAYGVENELGLMVDDIEAEEMFLTIGQTEIERGTSYYNGLTNEYYEVYVVGDSLAYVWEDEDSTHYVYKDQHLKEYEHYERAPVDVNGKLTFIFYSEELDKELIYYGGEIIGEEYDLIDFPTEVGGGLAFEACESDICFIVYKGLELRQYESSGPPINLGGKLAFIAFDYTKTDNTRTFVVVETK